jgi:coiled-coil domain-containing protein 12
MADRKARLAALAAKAKRTKPATEQDTETAAVDTLATPAVTFRNYTPADSKLAGGDAVYLDEPSSKRARQEEPTALQQALEKAKAEAAVASATSFENLAAVAPKKINRDLKRDVQARLDKLERRTQKTTVELLKERLQQEAEID